MGDRDSETVAAQTELFGSVFVLMQHLTRRTDAALEDWGLTSRQWLLLAVLTRGLAGSSPTLTEAAERYGSSRQNVKQIALGLEARGFLRLVPDPLDARATRLELTDKVRIFDEPEGRARGRALLEGTFSGLSGEDIMALRDLVASWVDALSMDRAVPSRAGHAQEGRDDHG